MSRIVWPLLVLWTAACPGPAGPRAAQPPAPPPPAASGDPGAAPTEETPMDRPALARPQEWPGTVNVTATGPLYFAGQPDPAGLAHAASLGVTHVLNIRTEPEVAGLGFDEAAEVERLGMKYVALPFGPDSFSRDHVAGLAAALAEAGAGGVLVHCASSNRIGGLWATYLTLERGVPFEEALEHGRAAGLRSPSMEQAAARVAASR